MNPRDAEGRRYVHIRPFDDGPVKTALAQSRDASHACVVCGRVVRHGLDRYYQRTASLVAVTARERVRRLIDYEPVCGSCGDRAVYAAAVAAVSRFHQHQCSTCGQRVGCTSATCDRHAATLEHPAHAVPEAAHLYRGALAQVSDTCGQN